MKISKSRSKLAPLAFVLMLTLSALVFIVPQVSAAPEYYQSYAYMGVIPNPAFAGETVLLHVGISAFTQTAEDGFHDLSVTITKPDGSTETISGLVTDSTGGTGTVYVVDMVGTYTFQSHFPAQWYNYSGLYYGFPVSYEQYYYASDSEIITVEVTEEARDYYPDQPLPTEYWTRPIDPQLYSWSTISGNWLMTPPNLVAYNNDDAPNTAHILWSHSMTTGGLVGGNVGIHSFETGDAYEGQFSGTCIIAGKLYYNRYKSGYPVQTVVCVDLHTGEIAWEKTLGDNERLSFGQTFYWDSYNYHGTFDYIYTIPTTGTLNAYDAFSGDYLFSYTDTPSLGAGLFSSPGMMWGSKGEIYYYSVDLTANTLSLWNSSRVVSDSGSWMAGFSGSGFTTYNGTAGWEWTIPISDGLPGSVVEVLPDRILGSNAGGLFGSAGDNSPATTWAISTEPGSEGTLLFNTTWNVPQGNLTFGWAAADLEAGVFVISAKETRVHYGFDIDTGELLWETDPQPYLDMWWGATYLPSGVNIAYGKLFSAGYAGIVWCYDCADGNLLWSYTVDDQYSEILWSNNWPLETMFFAGGKIYVAHTEHSPLDPKARGSPYVAIDVETGEEVWRIDGAFRATVWGGNGLIGDSIIATMSTYDMQVYAIGKGPSAITVSTPQAGATVGNMVTIAGTIMDISPGSSYPEQSLRFPNGVPCVSDDDISTWMLYVYMGFTQPYVNGVPIRFDAITPSGDCIYIGSTTSDMYGNYGFKWVPDDDGLYQIIATFEGSDAYYASSSTAYVSVDEAPAVATPIEPEEPETPEEPVTPEEPTTPEEPVTPEEPTTPEEPEPEPTETPLITTEVAIVLAVVAACIIGAVAYLALRRK